MAVPDFLIKYGADLADVKTQVAQLQSINTRMAQNLGADFQQATRVIGNSLDSVNRTTFAKNIGGQTKQFTQDILKSGQVIQIANGQYKQYTETNTILNGQLVKTSGAISDVTGQYTRTSLEAEKAGKSTKNLWDNIKELGSRAILTIPIWLALRSAVMGTMQAISQSFEHMIEKEAILEQVKRTMSGTTDEITKDFSILKDSIAKLSQESGKGEAEIAKAFSSFEKAGQTFETSMAGASGAVKLAVTLFGNTEEIATGTSRAFRMLADESGNTGTQIQQLNKFFAQLDEVGRKTNINEFVNSLASFAPTAKLAKMSLQETVSLVATLQNVGGQGSNVSNLLRTSISKLIQNLDLVAISLGVKVNPQFDTTTTVLMKTLTALDSLNKTGKLTPEIFTAMTEIFGGARTGDAIKALISLRGELEKNLKFKGDVDNFNKSFDEMKKLASTQVGIFHNLNKEIGEGFITGLVGADDFAQSMVKINEIFTKIRENAQQFGEDIRKTFTEPDVYVQTVLPGAMKTIQEKKYENLRTQITDALKGNLNQEKLTNLVSQLTEAQNLNLNIGIKNTSLQDYIVQFRKQIVQQISDTGAEESKQVDLVNQEKSSLEDTSSILLKKQEYLKIENQIREELKASGATEIETEQKILEVRQLSGRFVEKDIILQKELVGHLERLEQIELNRTRIKGNIDNKVEELRLDGATNVYLIQARNELEKQSGINQDKNSLLQKQIELEKAITAEKHKQTSFSSDAMKIYKIAQEKGVAVANQFAQFIQGKVPVSAFQAGGALSQYSDLLEKYFSDNNDQFGAMNFFLNGEGKNIDLPEIQLRQKQNLNTPLEGNPIIQTGAGAFKTVPNITTNFGGVNINVNKVIDKNSLAQDILNEILEGIRKNPAIQGAINEQIDSF
jgi:TP901 family phage tail tape measure protein